MSDYLEATWKNPRWWVSLPFTLLVMLPLVGLQMCARLVAFMARSIDQALEVLGGAINAPIHAWWRAEAARRQAAARQRLDPDF